MVMALNTIKNVIQRESVCVCVYVCVCVCVARILPFYSETYLHVDNFLLLKHQTKLNQMIFL